MHIELARIKKRLYLDNKVRNVKFFPGSDRDFSPQDFAREMNKYFVEAEETENAGDTIDIEQLVY